MDSRTVGDIEAVVVVEAGYVSPGTSQTELIKDIPKKEVLQDVAIANLFTIPAFCFKRSSNSQSSLSSRNDSNDSDSVNNAGLQEMYNTVPVPEDASWFTKMRAFMGPGILVAVGYMDPGNWATDLAGGSAFNNSLLFIILLANLMAMFLQGLSLRLGMVSHLDLAQACRSKCHWAVNIFLWITCEVAIAACDLAEVVGSAIAMKLLFGLPVVYGCIITAADVLLLLLFALGTIRRIELFVVMLMATIMVIMLVELAYAQPDGVDVLRGLCGSQMGPLFSDTQMLLVSIGIIGATVMPHNLYLHSSIVQTRDISPEPAQLRKALRFGLIDSCGSLTLAFVVNASLLMLSAATFFRAGQREVAELEDAYHMMGGLLGNQVAPVLFGVALLCAGQQSTLTGTLAGQIVMQGFVSIKVRPVLRRLISRLLAVVPAVVCLVILGDGATGDLLVYSQVILSFQLPFAVIPLVYFTSSRAMMGEFVNGWLATVVGAVVALVLVALNLLLIARTFGGDK